MKLTDDQIKLFFQCVGAGPIDKAKIVIFGNELGTAAGAGSTEKTIEILTNDWSKHTRLSVGEGFITTEVGTLPVNSTFLQCVSRMALAIRHNEPRFFDELSGQGKALLNKYILEELYRTDTAVINLKPLPQSTERHWDYENIEESRYHNLFNFTLLRAHESPWKDLRVKILKEAFQLVKDSLILGSGDKHNKKEFLKLVYPDIQFESILLDNSIQVYISKYPRIILSNYYSSYTGLGLKGLKVLFQYIQNNYNL